MPSTISLELIGIWFCVGFFVGAGWALGNWLVSRLLARF
jgi:hypothetical protein